MKIWITHQQKTFKVTHEKTFGKSGCDYNFPQLRDMGPKQFIIRSVNDVVSIECLDDTVPLLVKNKEFYKGTVIDLHDQQTFMVGKEQFQANIVDDLDGSYQDKYEITLYPARFSISILFLVLSGLLFFNEFEEPNFVLIGQIIFCIGMVFINLPKKYTLYQSQHAWSLDVDPTPLTRVEYIPYINAYYFKSPYESHVSFFSPMAKHFANHPQKKAPLLLLSYFILPVAWFIPFLNLNYHVEFINIVPYVALIIFILFRKKLTVLLIIPFALAVTFRNVKVHQCIIKYDPTCRVETLLAFQEEDIYLQTYFDFEALNIKHFNYFTVFHSACVEKHIPSCELMAGINLKMIKPKKAFQYTLMTCKNGGANGCFDAASVMAIQGQQQNAMVLLNLALKLGFKDYDLIKNAPFWEKYKILWDPLIP